MKTEIEIPNKEIEIKHFEQQILNANKRILFYKNDITYSEKMIELLKKKQTNP